jgi:HD superfamily phosphodiesterase
VRFNKRFNKFYDKKLKEADDAEIENDEIEEIEDVIEELDIEAVLEEIADKLGFDYTSSNGSGSYSISDNVEVRVRFTPKKISRIQTVILKNPARFDCTKNTTTVDNLSVELQTSVLIIKEIKQKLM